MLRDLIILGGGVHGAEMAEIVERVNRAAPTWNLLGFVSPIEAQVGTTRKGVPVLGGPAALAAYPEALLVCDNEWPRDVPVARGRLISLIDPSTFVSRTVRIGTGCVLYPNCFVGL